MAWAVSPPASASADAARRVQPDDAELGARALKKTGMRAGKHCDALARPASEASGPGWLFFSGSELYLRREKKMAALWTCRVSGVSVSAFCYLGRP